MGTNGKDDCDYDYLRIFKALGKVDCRRCGFRFCIL